MTNNEEERAFLEAQLQWIKWRDVLLEQIESKLEEMKYLAEQVASSENFFSKSEKRQLNERFIQLKNEVTELGNQLQIYYN